MPLKSPCPKCGYANPEETQVCGLCSSLLKQPEPTLPESIPQMAPPPPPVEKTRKLPMPIIIFFAGLALYPVVRSFCLLEMTCRYFKTLVHELGHTIMFLGFGQIALPRLDFAYGGGQAVRILGDENKGPILVILLLAGLIYAYRKNTRLMIFLIVLAVIYPFLAFTKGQDVLICAAGHLCEAVAAAICSYRCLVAGNTLVLERPIYAVLAWWLPIHGIAFSWQLATNMAVRAEYINDPVKYHDLVRIADTTGWDFGFVAIMFMLFYIIPIILGIFFVYLSARKPVGSWSAL
ncbi:MAG: hypothetical protein AB1599_07570 [Planctomycetota bacterium]